MKMKNIQLLPHTVHVPVLQAHAEVHHPNNIPITQRAGGGAGVSLTQPREIEPAGRAPKRVTRGERRGLELVVVTKIYPVGLIDASDGGGS